ncbi:MAG: NAD(P)-dependent oxidoreductase [Magnetococcales bacterium]|nr:NAD(P)-dependent oxidoreductase [Magnetococcales bacterium]
MRILITGAAGNLGTLLARHLLRDTKHHLHLMIHRKTLPSDLSRHDRVKLFQCDLSQPKTLIAASRGCDAIIHFGSVLFAPRPDRHFPITNTQNAINMIDVAIQEEVDRFILVSFPHVEGPTSPEAPCRGRLDATPTSIHARTRLAAEKYLLQMSDKSGMKAISLRPGMIYGADLLMIEFARILARFRMLAVWPENTPVHLLSLSDFNLCCQAALEKPDIHGIYPLGDDDPTTLQNFMDETCSHLGLGKPRRVPGAGIQVAAWILESMATIFGTKTPLTRDFIRIGRTPYFCDTSRMKQDLLPRLTHPSFREALHTLVLKDDQPAFGFKEWKIKPRRA